MLLKGKGVSEGVFQGRAIKYAKGVSIQPGDILIAYSTDPSMAPEMIKASAIITERGGVLSHAAIFCRELGVPCVVGVSGVLTNIKDYTVLKVDGKEGTVEVVE